MYSDAHSITLSSKIYYLRNFELFKWKVKVNKTKSDNVVIVTLTWMPKRVKIKNHKKML